MIPDGEYNFIAKATSFRKRVRAYFVCTLQFLYIFGCIYGLVNRRLDSCIDRFYTILFIMLSTPNLRVNDRDIKLIQM